MSAENMTTRKVQIERLSELSNGQSRLMAGHAEARSPQPLKKEAASSECSMPDRDAKIATAPTALTPSLGNFRKAPIPIAIIATAFALVFAISGRWNALVGARSRQSTDDAYLRSDVTPLSTKSAGIVARVVAKAWGRRINGT